MENGGGFVASSLDEAVHVAVGDGEAVVVVRGALVLRRAGVMRHAIHSVLDAGVRRIAVDLGCVTDVDPAGLAPLVVAARQLRASGGGLRFTATSTACTEAMRRLHLFSDALTDSAIPEQQPRNGAPAISSPAPTS